MNDLEILGYRPEHATSFAALNEDGRVAGRVVSEERGVVRVATVGGDVDATLAGRLRHAADLDPLVLLPAVGDWVVLAPGNVIQAVLPRHSAIVRRAPSDRSRPTQVLVANVDVAFIVMSLNADFNVRRLERFLAVAWESGATPVILLSKSDLTDQLDDLVAEAHAVALGVEVIPVSAVTGDGLADVRARLAPGTTVVFLGSSGVGKSSLVNALAGEPLLETAAIREDDARGRHTTTRRQLLRLAAGMVIDTPGLRELALLDADGLAETFDDVETIASGCRFSDCRHAVEPGCAVAVALADGTLDRGRFDAFRKLEREAHRSALAANPVARKIERKRWTAMIRGVERGLEAKYGADR